MDVLEVVCPAPGCGKKLNAASEAAEDKEDANHFMIVLEGGACAHMRKTARPGHVPT